MSVCKLGKGAGTKDWIIMWERLVKVNTLNLQKIRLFISASSIYEMGILQPDHEFTQIKISFYSSFFYHIFDPGARKKRQFSRSYTGHKDGFAGTAVRA